MHGNEEMQSPVFHLQIFDVLYNNVWKIRRKAGNNKTLVKEENDNNPGKQTSESSIGKSWKSSITDGNRITSRENRNAAFILQINLICTFIVALVMEIALGQRTFQILKPA